MSEPSQPLPSDAPPTPAATEPVKKKRRVPLWLKIVGVLVLLLALLVLFIPTIASTGPVRSFAVGKINENLNGRVEIADWSLGWLSGAKIKGVHVRDASGVDILQLTSLTSELSVLDIVRGNYSLGDAVVDGLIFDIRREADGKLNIEKLAKTPEPEKPQSPKPESPGPAKSEPPSKLPNVSGRLLLRNSHGTYEDIVKKQTVQFPSIDGTVNIPSINAPIETAFTVAAVIGQGKQGTLKISGTTDVIESNEVQMDSGGFDQVIALNDFDMPALAAFLPPGALGPGVRFDSGTAALNGSAKYAAGTLTIDLKGGVSEVNVSRAEAAVAPTPILRSFAVDLDAAGHFATAAGGRVTRLLLKDNQGLVSLTKSQADLVIPTDSKTQPSGEVVLDADLKKIDELMHSLQTDGKATTARRILAGVANARLSVGRDGDVVVLTPRIRTTGLAIGGGEVPTKTADVSVDSEVRLNSAAEEITIASLDARGPGTAIKLERPLVMKGSGAARSLSATLAGRIDLHELLATLEAWNGAAAGSMYPYAGEVVLRQDVTTGPGGAVTLTGGADVNNFAMTGQGAGRFDERLIKLANTIHYDGAAKSVKIDNVSVGMESTKAVTLTMNGAVHELDTTRRIDNIVVKLDYDAKILWDLLRPILDPETAGKSLEEITLGGKRSQTIQVSGSFPADDPHAVRQLRATGHFGLESLAMRGLAVAQLDLRFLLDKGVLRLEHTNPPPSDKLPPGSPCNGTGQISFHNVVIDMTGDHPRLVIPDGHPLIHDVSINPAVADTIIARFVNPAFKDAAQARGLLNVTVVSCRNLALDAAMQSTNSSESGRAELTWSLSDLFLGQPELVAFVSNIKPNALNENGFSGNIRNGKVIIEAGKVQNDMEFSLDKYGLRFDGGIGLAENSLIGFGVTLPKDLFIAIDDKIGKNARPEGYRVPLTGTTNNGLASAQQAILPILADLGVKAGVDSLLGRALGDKKSKNNEAAEPAKPEDLLDNLLERATGGGERETDAEKGARRAKTRQERLEKEQRANQAQQNAATQPTTTPADSELSKKERERLKKEEQRVKNQRNREEAERKREEKKKQREAK
jgi:hypothetical protein